MKVLFLGGDCRFIYACKYLVSKGIKAEVISSTVSRDTTISEYYKKINKSDVIVLPTPLTVDKINIKGTVTESGLIKISEINDLKDKKMILSPDNTYGSKNYTDESYLYDNAYLTAEGTVGHLLTQYKRILKDARITILGYGRISIHLLSLLKCYTDKITVILRDTKKAKHLENTGINTNCFSSLNEVMKNTDILINTVPSLVVDEKALSDANNEIYIVDLASKPGGIDFDFAKKENIDCVHLLGVPGKTAPISAGEIIGERIVKIIFNPEH